LRRFRRFSEKAYNWQGSAEARRRVA
jgi:hypothetical protein